MFLYLTSPYRIMGNLTTLLLFFVYSWGFGFTFTFWLKNADNFWERNLMRLGIGMGALITVGLLLNLLSIPLDWRLFLLLSSIAPLYHLAKHRGKVFSAIDLHLTKTNLFTIIILLMFSGLLFMYTSGAFSYPYLEDDDPWSHVLGVKYIAVEKTLYDSPNRNFQYIDPYPPGYDLWLGVLHQTSVSASWTLKFFTAMFVSIGIIFFYFFVRKISGSSDKALFSAIALAAMPAFLTHFIWAIALLPALLFVSLYALEQVKSDKRWLFVVFVTLVGGLSVSPSHSVYLGLLVGLWFIVKLAAERKFPVWETVGAAASVVFIFLVWWLPAIFRWSGVGALVNSLGLGPNRIFNIAGTGDRVYGLADFIAPQFPFVTAPTGFGLITLLLALVATVLFFLRIKSSVVKYGVAAAIFAFVLSVFLFLPNIPDPIHPRVGSDPSIFIYHPSSFVIVALAAASLLGLIALAFLSKQPKFRYMFLALVWFIFAFYAVNASTLPLRLSSFRAWVILAIPVAMLAGEGVAYVSSLLSPYIPASRSVVKYSLMAILAAGLFFTVAQDKIDLNTSAGWPAGAFWTYQLQNGNLESPELSGYIWMSTNIPKNSRVVAFANDAPVIGFDMDFCSWCDGVKEFQQGWVNMSTSEIHTWMVDNDYEYMIISGQEARMFQEPGIERANDLINSPQFAVVSPRELTEVGFLMLQVI